MEIVYREVEGLPKGTVKAVIDAYGELVDEGCLAIFGPSITDNAVPTREAIEQRFRVPAVSVTGTDDWLGEWTFSFPQGSLTDEPIFWADLLAKGGHTEVGVLIEQSLVGKTYLKNFRSACRGARAFASWRRSRSPRLRRTSAMRSARCTKRSRARSFTAASASGSCTSTRCSRRSAGIRRASRAPRSRTPGSTPCMWKAFLGWTGVDQYDEGNLVGQRFLDQYEAAYGRRPQYCVPVVNRDIATALLRAFADAHPLSPRGVKEALERVKMLPAAAGAPGTRVSLREVDPPGLDGRRLPRGPQARSGRRSTRISSTASGRTDDDGHRSRRCRPPPVRPPHRKRSLATAVWIAVVVAAARADRLQRAHGRRLPSHRATRR